MKVNQNAAMKKGGTKGKAGVGGGLSMCESMSSDPDGEGMGTKGPAQMPMPVAKKKVGKFEIC